MNKIKTIFKRDWEGNKKVINEYIEPYIIDDLKKSIATEKLDGTNVRITIRNNTCVRAEKRMNPNKIQKLKGIIDPWYIDADIYDPSDKYIYDGIKNTNFNDIADGEWSGELIGKNIQGNPLNLDNNIIIFFSLGQAPIFKDCPINYEELKEWLPKQKSKIGKDCFIEGIVWHYFGKYYNDIDKMYKIKTKDF